MIINPSRIVQSSIFDDHYQSIELTFDPTAQFKQR